MPQAVNVNGSVGLRSIMVQKSAAISAILFDLLKSLYCGTCKHNKVKRRCKRLTLKFIYAFIYKIIYLIYI